MFDRYFYSKEEKLRKPIENINDEFAENMIKWKQNTRNRRIT